MRWIIGIYREEAAAGLAWARAFVTSYDTSNVEWVRIDNGRGGSGLYGRCWYPKKEKRTFRLSCQVPGPWPGKTETRKPPVYRKPDGSWPPIPEGCERGAYCSATRNGVTREWFRVYGHTQINSLSEAVVWIISHEGFHWLRKSRQIPGRNTEAEADAFADARLEEFRRRTE